MAAGKPGPLAALAGYFLLGSLVDLLAYARSIVGPASVPSVAVRVVVGALCAATAWRAMQGGA
jgi:hypothetical protein